MAVPSRTLPQLQKMEPTRPHVGDRILVLFSQISLGKWEHTQYKPNDCILLPPAPSEHFKRYPCLSASKQTWPLSLCHSLRRHVGAGINTLLGEFGESNFESLLNLLEHLLVTVGADEGDGKTLGTEAAGTTDAVEV